MLSVTGVKARFPNVFAHSPSWRGPLPSSMSNQRFFLLLAATVHEALVVLRDLSNCCLPLSPRGTASLLDIAWSWEIDDVQDGQRWNVDNMEDGKRGRWIQVWITVVSVDR